MSAVKVPPPPALEPYRFTVREYRQLSLTGLFHDMKTLLLHGELYATGMPEPPHDVALNVTYEFLRSVCPAGYFIRNQQGFVIGADNDPSPDLAVVPGAVRDYAVAAPTAAALIVEVADQSLSTDTTTKAELYATAGVPEYWVIDLVNARLVVFRDPQPLPVGLGATAYRTHLTFGPADRVTALLAPTVDVLVSDLLP